MQNESPKIRAPAESAALNTAPENGKFPALMYKVISRKNPLWTQQIDLYGEAPDKAKLAFIVERHDDREFTIGAYWYNLCVGDLSLAASDFGFNARAFFVEESEIFKLKEGAPVHFGYGGPDFCQNELEFFSSITSSPPYLPNFQWDMIDAAIVD